MNTSQLKLPGALLIVVALALGVTGARRWNQPAHFHATTTVKVERDKIDRTELGEIVPATVDNTFFIQTEIELIQSQAPLSQVIEKLNLNQVWGKRHNDGQPLEARESFQLLKGCLQLQPVPGTTNIQIQVASDDAVEAADIANAVAQAYCDYRAGYRRHRAENSLAELSDKIREHEGKIAVAQKKVENARQELNPALREKAPAAGQPEKESDKLQKLRTRLSESVLRYIAHSNQFVIYSTASNHDEEIAKQLQERAGKTRAEMVAAEAAMRDELQMLDSLQSYQTAQQELDELNLLFAPIKKAVIELQRDLGPQERKPAEIVERATIPTKSDTAKGIPGQALLAGGGLALVLGIALILWAGRPVSRA